MADANTTLYGLVKPEVGASADTWGGKLNADMDDTDALLGAFVLTGSSSAYVLTTGLSLAAYGAKQRFKVQWNHTNASTSPTINVDGIGAKNLKKRDGSTNPSASDLVSGRWNEVIYDGTNAVITDLLPSDFQPLDATLTALAALSWSSGNALVQFTAADTVSLTLTPSVTGLTTSGQISIADGSASAPALRFSSATGTGIYWVSNEFAFSNGGAVRLYFNSARIQNTLLIYNPDGTAGGPSYAFLNDTDCGFYRIGADNIGFALGGTKRIDYGTSLIDFSVAARSRVPVSSETAGTLTSASANKKVNASGNITIDGNVFTADDRILIYAGASARTLTQGSTGTPTQRLHGTSTTGNLTLAARGVAVVDIISATEWVVSGDVT